MMWSKKQMKQFNDKHKLKLIDRAIFYPICGLVPVTSNPTWWKRLILLLIVRTFMLFFSCGLRIYVYPTYHEQYEFSRETVKTSVCISLTTVKIRIASLYHENIYFSSFSYSRIGEGTKSWTKTNVPPFVYGKFSAIISRVDFWRITVWWCIIYNSCRPIGLFSLLDLKCLRNLKERSNKR